MRALQTFVLLCAASARNANLSAPFTEPPLSALDGVVTVYATIAFLKIASIDVVSATFFADYYLYLAWRDDRVAGLAALPSDLWMVDPERINSADGTAVTLDPSVSVTDGAPSWLTNTLSSAANAGSWIAVWARLSGKLDGVFDLREFPFDSQSVQVIIESKNFDATMLVWAFPRDVAADAMPATLSVDGWETTSVVPVVKPQPYPAFGQTYSRFSLSVNIRRRPTYFVSKYVLNVSMIVIVALTSSYFMLPTAPDRIALTFAAYCAIISWIFVLVNQVPVLGYSTRLDNFMTVAFVCTFGLALFNGVRLQQGRRAAAAVAPDSGPPKTVAPATDGYRVLDAGGHAVIALAFGVAVLSALFAPIK